jgi:hypothetical protein
MPHSLYDWHDRIKAVEREYQAVRGSVAQMRRAISDGIGGPTSITVGDLLTAGENLEGTYLIRIWAEFETAVRSYYAWLISDPDTRIARSDQHCRWRPSRPRHPRGRETGCSRHPGLS